jgi:hypothetical protein
VNRLEGGAGDDVLVASVTGDGLSELFGGVGDDVLRVAGGGDSLLDDGSGSDSLVGGAGDDRLALDLADLLPGNTIDGGGGVDSLLIGFDLDLTAVDDGILANLERADLESGAAEGLTLAEGDVTAMTDDGNTLSIAGDDADTVTLVGAWVPGPVVGGFSSFTTGAATAAIDPDIITNIVA